MTEPFFLDDFVRQGPRRGYTGPPAVTDVDSYSGKQPGEAAVDRLRRRAEKNAKEDMKKKGKKGKKAHAAEKWFLPPPASTVGRDKDEGDSQDEEGGSQDEEGGSRSLPEDEESAEMTMSEDNTSDHEGSDDASDIEEDSDMAEENIEEHAEEHSDDDSDDSEVDPSYQSRAGKHSDIAEDNMEENAGENAGDDLDNDSDRAGKHSMPNMMHDHHHHSPTCRRTRRPGSRHTKR